jgi:hypothetical protein
VAINHQFEIPIIMMDDGVAFVFEIGYETADYTNASATIGFFHRPIHAAAASLDPGDVVTPPVTWSENDNMNSWVETVKYAARNKVRIDIDFDDEISLSYSGWSESTNTGGSGGIQRFQQVYRITG